MFPNQFLLLASLANVGKSIGLTTYVSTQPAVGYVPAAISSITRGKVLFESAIPLISTSVISMSIGATSTGRVWIATTISFPPTRVLESAALNAAGTPAASTDVSAPRPPVRSRMAETMSPSCGSSTVRTRTTRDEARLQAGGLPSRELESLQHEIATLARRQSTLEDELLEIMEQAEQSGAELAEAEARHQALAGELAELEHRRDEAFAEIDAAVARTTPERESIAAEIPAALVTLYERVRAHSGTGAAPLLQRRCGGCRLEINAVDLGRIRAAAEDDVLRCEECGRILVRTPESGL